MLFLSAWCKTKLLKGARSSKKYSQEHRRRHLNKEPRGKAKISTSKIANKLNKSNNWLHLITFSGESLSARRSLAWIFSSTNPKVFARAAFSLLAHNEKVAWWDCLIVSLMKRERAREGLYILAAAKNNETLYAVLNLGPGVCHRPHTFNQRRGSQHLRPLFYLSSRRLRFHRATRGCLVGWQVDF
jgi:hypothetical protein